MIERNKPAEEQIMALTIENDALKREIVSKNEYIQNLSRQLEQNLNNKDMSGSFGRFDSIKAHLASL